MDTRTLTPATRSALLRRGCVGLAITLGSNGELPTEFRLFVSGWNDTENGRYLFDDAAATSVMAAHAKWGVDLAIDLEHQMLAPELSPDPTSKDARGWCRLELRADGSLWAVAVKWTADGAARLSEKRQRYVSPAFSVDPETSRVTAIINVAITAIPATHDTPALVAASATKGGPMTLEEFMKVCKALGLDPSTSMEDAMAKIKGEAAPDPDAGTEDAPPPVGDGGADEATESAPPPAKEDPAKEEDKQAVMAATSRLTRITGQTTIGAAVDEVEVWRTSHLKLEAETVKLAKERAALELSKRKENAAKLVQLGADTPHTSGLSSPSGKLCKRLMDEPLDEQNARITALLAARGGKMPTETKPPVGQVDSGDLTPRELAMCAAKKIDPVKYAATRAGIRARHVQGA